MHTWGSIAVLGVAHRDPHTSRPKRQASRFFTLTTPRAPPAARLTLMSSQEAACSKAQDPLSLGLGFAVVMETHQRAGRLCLLILAVPGQVKTRPGWPPRHGIKSHMPLCPCHWGGHPRSRQGAGKE